MSVWNRHKKHLLKRLKVRRTMARRVRFESLESRQLLAADFDFQWAWAGSGAEGEGPEASQQVAPPSTFPEAGLMIDNGNAPNGLPRLSSNPAAAAKIYLDFDGHFEAQWGSYSNITTPAWSLDGDLTTFNTTEAAGIRAIWRRVAEDFAPFNIDVTTIEPASFANREGLRVAIGGNSSWYGSQVTGLAYRNTWTNSIVNTVYVFPANLSNNIKYIAEVASHEVGHAFGLYHQSTYNSSGSKTNEYNPGSGDWAPIMGNGLSRAHTTWHFGTSTSSTTFQDDLAVITSSTNAFGYRQDDHGGLSSPTPLPLDSQGNARVVGLIERMNDVDAFSFEVGTAGIGEFRVDVFDTGPNLKAVLQLWSGSELLVQANPNSTYGASISWDVTPGSYTLAVRNDGFYGRLGHYTVHVDTPTGASSLVAVNDFVEVLTGSDFVEIDVLANDTINVNPGYETLIVSVSTPTEGGQVEIVDGRVLRYRPAEGFIGQETFTYTISDDSPAGTSTATVTIDVTRRFFTLEAVDDAYSIIQDSDATDLDVLSNDTINVNEDFPTFIASVSVPSEGGTVEIVDGTLLRYRPAAGFIGQETFTYTISDDSPAGTSTATVTIEVTARGGDPEPPTDDEPPATPRGNSGNNGGGGNSGGNNPGGGNPGGGNPGGGNPGGGKPDTPPGRGRPGGDSTESGPLLEDAESEEPQDTGSRPNRGRPSESDSRERFFRALGQASPRSPLGALELTLEWLRK